ncbi:MAG: hypothetical protein IJ079_05970 [Lachnospiraceae bacterium]|nr:hypothetical protein [Lachnospiraceae bacterium]MBQ8983120.1 hypothetical protein [Lachnospiraceae bacterium]
MKKRENPKPTGEYAVGTFTYTVYNDRPEVLKEHENEMRSVAVRVYYPAPKEKVDGLKKARYLSREMTKAIKKAYFANINYDRIEANGENLSECYLDAPHVPGQKFPLIVFSHGYQSYREGNSFLCIELASRGYVVIAVCHSYEALLTELDDDTVIPFENRIKKWMYNTSIMKVSKEMSHLKKMKGSMEEKAEAIDQWQKSCCSYLNGRVKEWEKDTLAAASYAKEHYSDFIDFSLGIGVSGHSMGGAVAYALCQDYDDYKCGINIDGALFGEYDGKVMKKPYLQIDCRGNIELIYRGFVQKEAPAYRVIIEGMQHIGFSDLKHAIPIRFLVGKADPDMVHETVCQCHIEFFDTYLKGVKEEPEWMAGKEVVVESF